MTDDNGATQRPAEPASEPTSRRRFLRAAVIGTAGVTGGAVAAGVILSQRGTHILPAGDYPIIGRYGGTTSGKMCTNIIQTCSGEDHTHGTVEILASDLANFGVNTCVVLTAHSGDAPAFHTTIIATQHKQGSKYAQLCICPVIPKHSGRDKYPASSMICISTGCPTPNCSVAKCFSSDD